MKAGDFCKPCGGTGRILGQTSVYRCPKCKGSGWDPERVKAAGLDPEAVADTLYQATKPEGGGGGGGGEGRWKRGRR